LLDFILVSGGVVVEKLEVAIRHGGCRKKVIKKEERWFQRVGGMKNM
jgi:hypothetical protein